MRLIRSIRLILAMCYAIPLVSLALLCSICTLQYFSTSIWYYTAITMGKGSLWIMGIKVQEENPSNIAQQEARIFMYNHTSFLDILWLCAIGPPAFSSVTKKLFLYIPIINIVFWASGQIFIDRKNAEKAIQSLNKLRERVTKEKRTVFISPEGTRSTDGEILPFKKGGFHMAQQAQLPIYYAVVHGAFELMPTGSFAPKSGTIFIRYLPPIDCSNWTRDTLSENIENVRAHMIQEHNELRKIHLG